jgi:hypothetical protein
MRGIAIVLYIYPAVGDAYRDHSRIRFQLKW